MTSRCECSPRPNIAGQVHNKRGGKDTTERIIECGFLSTSTVVPCRAGYQVSSVANANTLDMLRQARPAVAEDETPVRLDVH